VYVTCLHNNAKTKRKQKATGQIHISTATSENVFFYYLFPKTECLYPVCSTSLSLFFLTFCSVDIQGNKTNLLYTLKRKEKKSFVFKNSNLSKERSASSFVCIGPVKCQTQ